MENAELAVVDPQSQQIAVFGSDKPEQIVTRATEVANVLAPIIEAKKLYKMIGPKKHVYAEGWTAMLALIGVFPILDWSRKVERENEIAYESRITLKTLSGQVVGSGEAICSSKERNWFNRDEYAVKSMSQTRATGKACRLPFSWIMTLAGYEACPAEEMPDDNKPQVQMPRAKEIVQDRPLSDAVDAIVEPESPAVEKVQRVMGGLASDKQRKMIFAKCRAAGVQEDELKSFLWEKWKIESTKDLSWKHIDEVLKWIDAYAPKV